MQPSDKPLTAEAGANGANIPVRPPTLTHRGAEALVQIEKLLEQASRDLAVSDRSKPAPRADASPGQAQRALAAATDGAAPAPVRGD
jgi:hypothetical protein